ncbi:hypothetical protein [Streptomyces sp. NPDC048606]|uniref:hypothetical protein n=1 Tax=Streptomyces sp. NPDC048606 TaxID=3154726 RepID=UPI00342DCE6D
MPATSARPPAPSPSRPVVPGLRAAVLAALCVLLPWAGHLLAQGHLPRWAPLPVMAVLAVPVMVPASRRELSDTRLTAALAGAQLAYHAAYVLPGACAAVADAREPAGILAHVSAAGVPPEVFFAGHLVMLVLAARVLGPTERLARCGRPVLEALRAALTFLRPLPHPDTGPGTTLRTTGTDAMPPSALVVRLNPGRAPPRSGRTPLWCALLPAPGPMPGGGPCPAHP